MKTILIAFVSLLCISSVLADTLPDCASKNDDFDCFHQHFKQIYSKNNSLFWERWRNYEQKALTCGSIELTSNFLSLVNGADGEIAEATARGIEKLILTNPKCFLAAVEKTDKAVRKKIVRYYVFTPLFHQAKEIVPVVEAELTSDEFPLTHEVFTKLRSAANNRLKQDW